ncbi:unnamed protein product, partial [Pleuronectes platessa]
QTETSLKKPPLAPPHRLPPLFLRINHQQIPLSSSDDVSLWASCSPSNLRASMFVTVNQQPALSVEADTLMLLRLQLQSNIRRNWRRVHVHLLLTGGVCTCTSCSLESTGSHRIKVQVRL